MVSSGIILPFENIEFFILAVTFLDHLLTHAPYPIEIQFFCKFMHMRFSNMSFSHFICP